MLTAATTEVYDAIIIGGGPGGSAAGSMLAQSGKKVLVIERERFPRFHVGESLIPYINDELRAIGVWEKLEQADFMPKLGAEFALGNSGAVTSVLFGRFLPCSHARTFQVERSRFDHILLDHAAASGCEVWQESRVETLSVSDEEVSLTCRHEGEERVVRARWVLDASGRDAVLGKHLKLPKSDLGLTKKFATFAHFEGVFRNPQPAEGHITIVRLDFGWCWIIPLTAEKTSVGLVQDLAHFQKSGMKPEQSFEHVVANSSELQRRLGSAKRVSEFFCASDYSYRYQKNAGPRWMLIGDAAGFIDPIFSSGVMLAVKSGCMAAREILASDKAGRPLTRSAQNRYTRQVGGMCGVFLRMIQMFYDNRAFEVFMTPIPVEELQRAVNNLVAGNTNLGWKLRARVWLFYLVCAIQKRFELVPRIDWSTDRPATPAPIA